MRLAALAALLLLPSLAGAQSLRLLDTGLAQYQGDNGNAAHDDDEYGVGRNRLELSAFAERATVSAQVDAAAFTSYPDIAPSAASSTSAYHGEARLERLLLTYQRESLALTVGDHPRQLGRGIALSLRKVDELGIDHALRGGAVRLDTDRFSSEVFAGRTNTENLDPVTLKFREDPGDTLAGASATMHLDRADVSVHGLYLEPREPTLPDVDDRTALGGAWVEVPAADWLSLYAEGAFEQNSLAGRQDPGIAAYGSADVDLQLVSVLLEGLFLDGFTVAGSFDPILKQRTVYNQPPTLERFDQEVLDNRDVRGGRVRVSRSFADGALVTYVSGMFRSYKPPGEAVDAIHGYTGFELTYDEGRSRWNLSGGYRQETTRGESGPFATIGHGETQWMQALGGAWSLHVDVTHESRRFDARRYARGSTLLGIERGHLGSVTTEIGYDTQNEDQRNFFLAGIVTYHATDDFFLRAVVGTQRGGIKCIGGVCRDFPPFAGARLEATVRYDAM